MLGHQNNSTSVCQDDLLGNQELTSFSQDQFESILFYHILLSNQALASSRPDRLSKSGSSLSQTEGQILIDIMNNHGLEQLVNFPTRERNTLDLILTSLPGQFVDIHSPDKLSDHDIVSGTMKIAIPPVKKGTSRQRSGKGAIRKRFPLQKPRWEKTKEKSVSLSER